MKAQSPERSTKKKSPASARMLKVGDRNEETPWIGIVAPAFPIPQVELQMGAERAAKKGFSIALHPQITHTDGIFAGSDSERALAFLDYAYDPEISMLWSARGGYGCMRLLPLLDEIVGKVGVPPRKTLVGYSDLTVLLDYVATKWGWRVVHGPMPATDQFARVKGKDFESLIGVFQGGRLPPLTLNPLCVKKGTGPVQGILAGGNLATIASLVGTPYQMDFDGKILFLEEVGEYIYRIDRFLQQLLLSGSLKGVRAIVLGTFTQCEDACPQVLKSRPKSESARAKAKRIPLRRLVPEKDRLHYLFAPLSEELGIPVYQGVNVGHGDGTGAIELNVKARIQNGKLTYL